MEVVSNLTILVFSHEKIPQKPGLFECYKLPQKSRWDQQLNGGGIGPWTGRPAPAGQKEHKTEQTDRDRNQIGQKFYRKRIGPPDPCLCKEQDSQPLPDTEPVYRDRGYHGQTQHRHKDKKQPEDHGVDRHTQRERRENGEDCLECFGANFDRLPGGCVHIYDDESANVEALVELLRDWVRRTGYTEPIAFEWAVTSSCPRPGEFGGGAVVIYNAETTWLSTMQWMKDVAQEKMEAA